MRGGGDRDDGEDRGRGEVEVRWRRWIKDKDTEPHENNDEQKGTTKIKKGTSQ